MNCVAERIYHAGVCPARFTGEQIPQLGDALGQHTHGEKDRGVLSKLPVHAVLAATLGVSVDDVVDDDRRLVYRLNADR